jgi:nifR3 family TIM-barrel protein
MTMLVPITHNKLYFAPLESVTDAAFRTVIQRLYPEWDVLATDFLRVPSQGRYPEKFLIKHFGFNLYQSNEHREKTIFQILTSENAYHAQIAQDLDRLGFKWLDLNLGCPSNTVIKRKGGSFLLSQPEILRPILDSIRQNFTGRFTVKMRIGFEDDQLFKSNLQMIENCGIEAITLHARTRVQLYKGIADWNYIKMARQTVAIPIIGNGDVWNIVDAQKLLESTNCHGMMLGRGAMKAPWFAKIYKSNSVLSNSELKHYIQTFLDELEREFILHQLPKASVLKRFKQLTRYMFDDLPHAEQIKRQLLISSELEQYKNIVKSL